MVALLADMPREEITLACSRYHYRVFEFVRETTLFVRIYCADPVCKKIRE